MCAAPAAPVRALNVSSQATVAPVAEALTVAVNVPRATATSPFGAGTSCEAFKVVARLMVVGRAVRGAGDGENQTEWDNGRTRNR